MRRSVTIPHAMIMAVCMSVVAWAYNTLMQASSATSTLEAVRVERDRCTDKLTAQRDRELNDIRVRLNAKEAHNGDP